MQLMLLCTNDRPDVVTQVSNRTGRPSFVAAGS
jgi:hypothetical protein